MADYLKSAPGTEQDVARLKGVRDTVDEVISAVRERGDDAVREYSEKFDGWSPKQFRLGTEHIEKIVAKVPAQALADIATVQARVRRFAQYQKESLRDFEVEFEPGVHLGQRNIPVAAAGAYVPGGRYPLVASAHMTVVKAKVAGVERVTACTPPIRGEIPAATVAAMHLAGADEIFLLGGTQAVAAMALGTETIGNVDLLAGPGNAYVAEAKRQLFGEVGIDLLAGPTEVLIVADDHADAFVVAVDLLSQAEHGPDSPAVLNTTSERLGRRVMALVDEILVDMPTSDFAGPAWRDHGEVVVVESLDAAYALLGSLRIRARAGPDSQSPRGAGQDAQLRRVVPRRGHLRLLRRQGDRHEPHTADPRGRQLHRWPVGGQVPEDRHLPGSHRQSGQRCPGRAVRTHGSRGAVRGPRPLRRRAGSQVRRCPASVGARQPVTVPSGETVRDFIDGRTALVTGAGNGLGRAIALELAALGARVLLTGRHADKLESVAAEIGEAARVATCDTASHRSVAELAATFAHENVSILVNNAGIAGSVAPLTEIDVDDWDEVFAVNVRGVYLMCKAFLPAMIERGAGDVVNIASVSGNRPLARRTPYTASKMAVIGLTATLAHEVGPLGITVNTLSPGPVSGPRMERNFALEATRTGTSAAEAEEEFVSRAAMRRMVTEHEVALAVVAILSMPGLCGADIDLSAGMIAR